MKRLVQRRPRHEAARLLPRVALPMSLASVFWQPIGVALLAVATWIVVCCLVAWRADTP